MKAIIADLEAEAATIEVFKSFPECRGTMTLRSHYTILAAKILRYAARLTETLPTPQSEVERRCSVCNSVLTDDGKYIACPSCGEIFDESTGEERSVDGNDKAVPPLGRVANTKTENG